MNDEERRIITQYVERVAGAAPAPAPSSPSPWGGSVPSTQARPNLPPVDREADALIADLFARYPEARYRITQTAFVQEAALVEAQNRIRQLEWEVENARRQAQSSQQSRGGLFGGMFGGGGGRPAPQPMSPPPQPVYPPGYNPGMLQPQRGGSGFLGTALTTAAGVAGGMVLGNMLMGALSGHGGAAHAAAFESGGGDFAQEAVPTSSPWSDPGAAAASQGWGSTPDAPQNDATGAGYDDPGYGTDNVNYNPNDAGYDQGNAGYDSNDAGGDYDDEV
ncbi:DUF2076 domain-containing protein [Paracraurococcus lichenis]|uniref:DUF2076 domain-containing protein n=1 Tax=Paracraurococcus lichenis TaxID=3064888 RepID=A0ABT9DSN1_9PROT|nr:DUF2076 domain-containing protein [Paracraurococcus sp. LOR1-02]MDO9706907.1 DUF2076 domain-containing protein [Paracraurococcus sp. LOR1-02]